MSVRLSSLFLFVTGIISLFANASLAVDGEALKPAAVLRAFPSIKAESAILVDAKTGTVLFSHNANQPRPIASTQKLLTALLVVEEGNLDKGLLIVESDTLAEPTKLGFKVGDMYSRRALLTALLIKSMNDSALALARDNAGSVEAFADKMNRRAFVLGANHSHFVNPNGLPADDQYSTASDLSIIAQAAYENPTLREIMATKQFVFEYFDGRKVPFRNTNRVLREQAFCNGMKTGYTEKARHCLVASGFNGEKEVIAVVLGCKKGQAAVDATALLCYGLDLPYAKTGVDDDAPAPKKKPSSSKNSGRKKKSK